MSRLILALTLLGASLVSGSGLGLWLQHKRRQRFGPVARCPIDEAEGWAEWAECYPRVEERVDG